MKCCLEVTMDLETGEASKSGNTAQHSVTHLDHCGHYPPSYCGCAPGSERLAVATLSLESAIFYIYDLVTAPLLQCYSDTVLHLASLPTSRRYHLWRPLVVSAGAIS